MLSLSISIYKYVKHHGNNWVDCSKGSVVFFQQGKEPLVEINFAQDNTHHGISQRILPTNMYQ